MRIQYWNRGFESIAVLPRSLYIHAEGYLVARSTFEFVTSSPVPMLEG